MIKLINNWIFTLIEASLLVIFTVLLLAFEGIFNVLFGVALIVYSLIFVLSKVISYRGIIQMITILEFFAVTILAIFVIVNKSIFPEGNIVNTTVGVAMWFRATTEILHSYHGQGEGRAAKRQFNAWKIFVYILLVSLGTYIATNAAANDDFIRYLIAGISTAAAIIMGVLTYTNYRDYREANPKPVKVKKTKELDEKADDDSNKLPDGKEEKPNEEKNSEPDKPEVKEDKKSEKAQEEPEVIYEKPESDTKPSALPEAKKSKKSTK